MFFFFHFPPPFAHIVFILDYPANNSDHICLNHLSFLVLFLVLLMGPCGLRNSMPFFLIVFHDQHCNTVQVAVIIDFSNIA